MNTFAFGFAEIFDLGSSGVPMLKRTLIIADIPLSPGMRWQPGFTFAGCDIANYLGQPVVAIDKGADLLFLGFAALDGKNSGWAKGWLVLKEINSILFGFYPTEYLAKQSVREAGEGFVVRCGSKRLGNNDEFNTSGSENAT